jgi:hypothetical protein
VQPQPAHAFAAGHAHQVANERARQPPPAEVGLDVDVEHVALPAGEVAGVGKPLEDLQARDPHQASLLLGHAREVGTGAEPAVQEGLGELPAVLTLDAAEQPEEVASGALPGLRAGEAMGYSPVQFSQRLRPSDDRHRPGDPTLRNHGTPFLVPSEG